MYMSAAYLSRRVPQLPRTAVAANSRSRKHLPPETAAAANCSSRTCVAWWAWVRTADISNNSGVRRCGVRRCGHLQWFSEYIEMYRDLHTHYYTQI